MATISIANLPAFVGGAADPPDLLVMVDVSDLSASPRGTTKQMTLGQVVVPAANIGAGSLAPGVIVPAGNIGAGTVVPGVIVPAANIGAGTVIAGVIVPAANVAPGTFSAGPFTMPGSLSTPTLFLTTGTNVGRLM